MAADNSEATRLVRLCSSSLAAFFTVLFMVHAVHKKAYKDFAKRVTMALVLGNLLHAIVDLLGLAFNNSLLCTIYGIVRSWALLSTATWSVVLAVHIFLLLRYNRSIRTRERWIQLACWSLPIPAALVPLSDSSSFGEAGLWCWITASTATTQAYQFICFYIPMWAMLTVICILYGRTMLTVYEVHSNVAGSVHGSSAPTKQQDLVSFAVRKLIGFPAIFVATWIPGTIHRVYAIFDDDDTAVLEVMDRVHAISLGLQGTLFVLYFHRRRLLAALGCAGSKGRGRYVSTTAPQPSVVEKPRAQELSRVDELDSKESSSTFNPLSSTFNESQMTHTYGQASFAHGSYSVTSLTDAGTTAASLSDEHALQPDASSSGTDRPAAL